MSDRTFTLDIYYLNSFGVSIDEGHESSYAQDYGDIKTFLFERLDDVIEKNNNNGVVSITPEYWFGTHSGQDIDEYRITKGRNNGTYNIQIYFRGALIAAGEDLIKGAVWRDFLDAFPGSVGGRRRKRSTRRRRSTRYRTKRRATRRRR